jgi:aquaporin Z
MAASNGSKYLAEFIGTFLLVFTVGCNVLGKTPVWAGVSIASVLMVSIYALGKISGGNFNPCVSIAIGLYTHLGGTAGGMDWGLVGKYIGIQIIAGIVAAFSYCILFWNAFNLGPSKGFSFVSAGMCEALYTFMLTFVVLNVAVAKKNEFAPNQFYGLAIGFVIIAGAYGAGVVSGGCFNPAVAIAIDISSTGLGFGWCIYYTICELIGTVVAVFAFKAVRPGDFRLSSNALGLSELNHSNAFGHSDASKLISEFLGTFMLVLTVGLNVLGNSPAGAFSIAASLMCMIFALGDVSGAHFNPAVTLAIFLSKDFRTAAGGLTGKMAGLYMLVQIVGGVTAAFTYSLIYSGHTFALGPQPGYKWAQVAVAETIFTFILCYVVLCTAVINKTKSDNLFGLAIGSCVTVGGFAIGSISGGSLNPAVSMGIAASQIMNGGMFYKALIYTAFEFTGAALATGIATATHMKETY